MTAPRSSTRNSDPLIRPIPSGARSRMTTSTVEGSVLRSDASATHGELISDRRHSARSTASTLRPRRSCSMASTSPLDSRWFPFTLIRSIWKISSPATIVTARYPAYTARPTTMAATTERRRPDVNAPRFRAGFICARRKRLSAGAVTRMFSSCSQVRSTPSRRPSRWTRRRAGRSNPPASPSRQARVGRRQARERFAARRRIHHARHLRAPRA